MRNQKSEIPPIFERKFCKCHGVVMLCLPVNLTCGFDSLLEGSGLFSMNQNGNEKIHS